MALVVPYESSGNIQNASGGSASQMRSASAFAAPGDNIGQGLQQLAGGLDKLNHVVFDAELQQRQERLELEILDSELEYQDAVAQWSLDYRQNYQEKNAVNADEDAEIFYTQKGNEILSRFSNNEFAKQQLEKRFSTIAFSGVQSMRSFKAGEQERWKDRTFATVKERFQTLAEDWTAPDEAVEAAYSKYADGNIAYLVSKGVEPEDARMQTDRDSQNILQQRRVNTFYGKLESGDPEGAEAILNGKARSVNLPEKLTIMVQQAAAEHGVNPGLVSAVLAAESAGNAKAVSPVGARGLMQLMPDTQKELEKKHGIDGSTPDGNLKLGTLYLKELLNRYQGNEELALMAYNWGPGNADSFAKNGHGLKTSRNPTGAVPRETKNYVGKILGSNSNGERAALNPMIDPVTAAKMGKALHTAKREQLKTNSIAQLSAQYPEAPDMAVQAALRDPNLAQDQQIQRGVVDYFDWQARQQREIAKQAELAHLEQSYSGIVEAAQKKDYRSINNIIISARPEDMSKLQTFADRIANGDGLVSDPVAYNDALLRAENEQVFDVQAEYGDRLNLKEIREVQKTQTNSYLAREKAFFDEEAERWLGTIEGKLHKKKNNTTASKLYMKFKAMIPEGGFKDIGIRSKALTAFWRREILSKPGMLWGNNDVEMVGFRAGEYAAEGYYPQKGSQYQELMQLVKAKILENEGKEREPTEGELTRAYQSLYGQEHTVKQEFSMPKSKAVSTGPSKVYPLVGKI